MLLIGLTYTLHVLQFDYGTCLHCYIDAKTIYCEALFQTASPLTVEFYFLFVKQLSNLKLVLLRLFPTLCAREWAVFITWWITFSFSWNAVTVLWHSGLWADTHTHMSFMIWVPKPCRKLHPIMKVPMFIHHQTMVYLLLRRACLYILLKARCLYLIMFAPLMAVFIPMVTPK